MSDTYLNYYRHLTFTVPRVVHSPCARTRFLSLDDGKASGIRGGVRVERAVGGALPRL